MLLGLVTTSVLGTAVATQHEGAACRDEAEPRLGERPWLVPFEFALKADPAAQQRECYDFMWRTFIALNWPADPMNPGIRTAPEGCSPSGILSLFSMARPSELDLDREVQAEPGPIGGQDPRPQAEAKGETRSVAERQSEVLCGPSQLRGSIRQIGSEVMDLHGEAGEDFSCRAGRTARFHQLGRHLRQVDRA